MPEGEKSTKQGYVTKHQKQESLVLFSERLKVEGGG